VDGWVHVHAPDAEWYFGMGKYQFFERDPWVPVSVVVSEITQHGFRHAKIGCRPGSFDEYAYCLFGDDDSRERELLHRWRGWIKYRWWKSNKQTQRGVYGGRLQMTDKDIDSEHAALLAHLTAQGIAEDVVLEELWSLRGPYTLLTEEETEARGIEFAGYAGFGSGLVRVQLPRDRRGRWVWWAYLPDAGPHAGQLSLGPE
jgi:hypothetical protein